MKRCGTKMCIMPLLRYGKRSRINTLTHEYELFKMNQNETKQDMQKRFTYIVNNLASLGKIFPNEDLINKVLRCLSRE